MTRREDARELRCVGNMIQYLVFLKLGDRHMGTHCISYALWMSEIFHNLKIDGIEKYLVQLYMGYFFLLFICAFYCVYNDPVLL